MLLTVLVCVYVYAYMCRSEETCHTVVSSVPKLLCKALNKDLYTKITLTETHACIRTVNGAYVHIT